MGLRAEIWEQPQVVAMAAAANTKAAQDVARLAADCSHAIVAARGTSDNAGRYAQYVWGTRNQLSVGLTTPSLFSVYPNPPSLTDALVIGISQSGESPDIVSVLEEAARQGRPTVAITNEPDSPLAAAANVVLDLSAGNEMAVAATKTYTAELACVALISEALGADGSLDDIPAAISSVLEQENDASEAATAFADMEHCAVLGRGFNHATAFEWALKLQELTYVVAQPFSTADFLHGPIAVLEDGYPVLAIAAKGPVLGDLVEVLERARGSGARVVTITNDDSASGGEASLPIPSNVPEWLTPIPAIVAAQLFAYHLTKAKGLDVEQPRGLRKVTRTT